MDNQQLLSVYRARPKCFAGPHQPLTSLPQWRRSQEGLRSGLAIGPPIMRRSFARSRHHLAWPQEGTAVVREVLPTPRRSTSPCSSVVSTPMIASFLYGTCICGQVLYWAYLRHQSAIRDEACWRVLNILTCTNSNAIAILACATPHS